MIIGSVSENKEIEKRISITTDLVKKYISSSFEILLEEGFGKHLGILDDEFIKEGCKIDKRENILKQSDVILQLNLPDDSSLEHIKENNILIGNFNSSQNLEKIKKLKIKKNFNFFLRAFAKDYKSSVNGYSFFASKFSWV